MLAIESMAALCIACLASAPVCADDSSVVLDPVVVTATRQAQRTFDIPASVSTIDQATIQTAQPMVNLSETLVRIPGIVANNRQNYAQDLQISSRGFGARATFGVRGIQLYQDDIPQTMPDGQGQTGSFMLLETQRIEVLRGPFSALYGNAAGGVISVFSETGQLPPSLTVNGGGGSYGTWTAGVKASGVVDDVNYIVAATHFSTDGYRDHSSAKRELGVAKLNFPIAPGTTMTFLATSQEQPNSLDPLGLTRAEWEANPRQADPAATQFDTRKSIRQVQGGVTLDHAFDDATSLKITAYTGDRTIRQFLAFSGTVGASAGGVTDLDRNFDGGGIRLSHRFDTDYGSPTLIVGYEYQLEHENRAGYANNNGTLGVLRSLSTDQVSSSAVYAQVTWPFAADWSATVGLRATEVPFEATDELITPTNPDYSGSATYRKTTPIAGLLWHATNDVNLYASYGQGFETPTTTELAYRSDGPGLNLGLQPASSVAGEVGVKALLGHGQRIDAALFAINTDNEIIVDTATGGRTTYKNAGKTTRRGAELAYDGDYGNGLTAHLALTWLRAIFADGLSTGTPPVPIAEGNRLPGVPAFTAFGDLAWTPPGLSWLTGTVEVQSAAKVYVNELNIDAAPAYTIANLSLAAQTRVQNTLFKAFIRLNNITALNYVGSVIVGDTNGRYFESAAGRNWFAGVSANVAF
jgi:iron complex outermembrane receptor protein